MTLPDVMKFPQSSMTLASIAVGQAATVAKPEPSCVKTGTSFVGVQLPASGAATLATPPVAPGVKTSTTAMWFAELCGGVAVSENPKKISAKYTPAAKPVT